MNRLNLNTTFPIRHDGPGLPVLVDLNWHGRIMTSQDQGITNRGFARTESKDEVVL